MEITFLRHGIAVDRMDPLCPVDFDRPLTVEGKNKVEGAVRGLRALGVKPLSILTSPFVRCVQTANLAARGLGVQKRDVVVYEHLAPGSDPAAFWHGLSEMSRERLLAVGHGDTIEPIAGLVLGFPFTDATESTPAESPLALRVLHLKKAGALQLEVPTMQSELGTHASHARLVWLQTARVLRQLGRG